jgi:hypothetical protein
MMSKQLAKVGEIAKVGAVVLVLFCIVYFVVPELTDLNDVSAQITIDCTDPANANDPQCEAPRLRDLQDLVVKIVYYVWALGLPVFTIIAMYIGYQYMISGADTQKQQKLAKAGISIVVGIIVFFATYPIADFFMKLVVTNPSDCYANLDTPGFTFFFPEVCTYQSVENPADDGVGGCCDSSALAGSDDGCFLAGGITLPDGSPPFVLVEERCTVEDGACKGTGLSCESSELTGVSKSTFENSIIECSSRNENREVKLSDGTIKCQDVDGSLQWVVVE